MEGATGWAVRRLGYGFSPKSLLAEDLRPTYPTFRQRQLEPSPLSVLFLALFAANNTFSQGRRTAGVSGKAGGQLGVSREAKLSVGAAILGS
jgi:hypothetical protein